MKKNYYPGKNMFLVKGVKDYFPDFSDGVDSESIIDFNDNVKTPLSVGKLLSVNDDGHKRLYEDDVFVIFRKKSVMSINKEKGIFAGTMSGIICVYEIEEEEGE